MSTPIYKIEGNKLVFPEFSKTTPSGRTQIWKPGVYIVDSANKPINITNDMLDSKNTIDTNYKIMFSKTHGQKDGKMVTTETRISKGKNLSKANRTNALTQAISEAEKLYNKNAKKKEYHESRALPILFTRIKTLNVLNGEYYVSPKLNGINALAHYVKDGNAYHVDMHSRTSLKEHSFETPIRDELKEIFTVYPDIYLNGELYKHGLPLQDIASIVNSEEKDTTINLYLFDVFNLDDEEKTQSGININSPFKERYKILQDIKKIIVDKKLVHIHVVPYIITDSIPEIEQMYKDCIESRGYEGIVIRDPNNVYQSGIRSKRDFKYKPLYSEEFTIVGYTAGKKGISADAIIWICETKQGKTFKVVPNGTNEERKKLYLETKTNKEKFDKKYVNGKTKLTVEFATYSSDKIPTQPKGIVIRNYD
jgi:DNA ligase 1